MSEMFSFQWNAQGIFRNHFKTFGLLHRSASEAVTALCVCFFLCFCVHGDVFIESDSHFIHTLNANASQMTDLY